MTTMTASTPMCRVEKVHSIHWTTGRTGRIYILATLSLEPYGVSVPNFRIQKSSFCQPRYVAGWIYC